jgi:hypothetical protein
MILGFPGSPSVFPGETILFHVSTDAPEFRIELYRQGATLTRQGCSGWFPGTRSPLLPPGDDWSKAWRGHALSIPRSFPPGVYVAMFVEGDGAGHESPRQRLDRTDAAGAEAKALFVIRNPMPGRTARILYKIPLFTYCAYNAAGDPAGSLYTGPESAQGRRVTLRRPGNGAGGTPWDAGVVDFYDRATPRQTYEHWDAKFIRWLEADGRAVDYATDLDVHRNDGNFLSAYPLLLSVGHDEYWSAPLRAHVASFVDGGGNLALFSANVCYWRTRVEDEGAALVVDKRVHPDQHIPFDLWRRTLPENALTGVGYHEAGGHWDGPRPCGAGYTVVRSGHWIFEGTGLEDGAKIGEAEALVGYESDGAAFTRGEDDLLAVTGARGTPRDFEILATASVAAFQGAEAGALSIATMGIHARRGTVFTAATVDWARVLAGKDPIVDRITRNVIDRLAARKGSGASPSRRRPPARRALRRSPSR